MVYNQDTELILEALQEFYYTCVENAAKQHLKGNYDQYKMWMDKSRETYRVRNNVKESLSV